MTGLTSNVSIASNAILLLGGGTIASLTEDSAQSIIAANLYENSYLSVLTSHRWRFATKKAKLSRLSETPINGYSHKFQIPSDCLYVIKADTNNYEIYESTIHCNSIEVEIDYTYRVDESSLPAYFTKMLEFFLASQFAVPLTGDLNKADMYYKSYSDQLKKAKFADSTQRPNVGIQHSPYVDARY